jgi:hypothetical protein
MKTMSVTFWVSSLRNHLLGYITQILRESVHFDFMTAFKRILAHPKLGDVVWILAQHDLAEKASQEDTLSGDQVRAMLLEIPISISVEDLKQSSYQLHENNRLSVLDYYWMMIAWIALGDNSEVPYERVVEALPVLRQVVLDSKVDIKDPVLKLGTTDDEAHLQEVGENANPLADYIFKLIDQSFVVRRQLDDCKQDQPDELVLSEMLN